MSQIRLLFDARCVRPDRSGVGNAAHRQLLGIQRLIETGAGWEVFVLRNSLHMGSPGFSGLWAPLAGMEMLDCPADPSRHPSGDWWQQWHLPRLARRLKADIVYSPAFVGPVYTGHSRSVIMIHDDMVWTQPDSYPSRFRLYMKAMTRLSARSADRVLYPSEDARRRCDALLGIDPERSAAVWHGIDTGVFHPSSGVSRDPLVVCLASAEKRKNQDVLVAALKDQSRIRMQFVGFSADARERLERLRAIDGGRNWEIVPHADEAAIVSTLHRAATVALPSRGEGFGFPVIEALATGTPLILSDIGVFREIAGPAATYCPADDPAAWRLAIEQAIAPAPEIAVRTEAGLERIKLFTLKACAEKLLDELKRAL